MFSLCTVTGQKERFICSQCSSSVNKGPFSPRSETMNCGHRRGSPPSPADNICLRNIRGLWLRPTSRGRSRTSNDDARQAGHKTGPLARLLTVAMGHGNCSPRLQSSIQKASSVFQRHCDVEGATILRPSVKRGDPLSSAKTSNKNCSSTRRSVQVLQPLLCYSQEGRRSPSHLGSESFKQIPEKIVIQDAHLASGEAISASGGLVHHSEPEGCLFSRGNTAKTQTVPTLCLRVRRTDTRFCLSVYPLLLAFSQSA